MTNYKEILRLAALGISTQDIAASCQCSRNTVRNVVNAAAEQNTSWLTARESSNESLRQMLFPGSSGKVVYRMPDYEHVHHEMQKSGVTLSLLWVEYCEQCRANGDIPYQCMRSLYLPTALICGAESIVLNCLKMGQDAVRLTM